MKISIITINLNNLVGLSKTIESVVNQTIFDQIEYIVIDGASTDGSKELIESYANKLTYWVSEPDSGIYNAMNKGIRVANGDYCQFLNSGDYLVTEVIIEKILNLIPDCDIFVGNKISIMPNGKLQKVINYKVVSLRTFYNSTIQHCSAFICRSLFEKFGFYDETLKIVSDWKWFLIVAGLNKANVQFTDLFVAYFDTSGISSTNLALDKTERRKVLEELIPEPILCDYDKYHFDIVQMERIKKHHIFYYLFWFVERSLFKIEKWKSKFYKY